MLLVMLMEEKLLELFCKKGLQKTNQKEFRVEKYFGGRVKVELVLSNYATKADLENQQVLIHQNLLKKVDLASLKLEVDRY